MVAVFGLILVFGIILFMVGLFTMAISEFITDMDNSEIFSKISKWTIFIGLSGVVLGGIGLLIMGAIELVKLI